MMAISAKAQDLSSHKWQERLVLVLAKDTAQQGLKDQLKELGQHTEGMQERKIVIYQVLPDRYRIGMRQENAWLRSNKLSYDKYSATESHFELVLIGLDGGIKLRRQAPITCKELFAHIDGMPMRKAEIRRDNHK